MQYSIGEISEATGIPISTLRYYDRKGFFPDMERSKGGIRVFSDAEIETIKIVECLKTSGLIIKEIKQFLDWCQEGDVSLQQRQDLFCERLDAASAQMEALQKTINVLKYKCWYYKTALELGSEEPLKDMPENKIPEELLRYKNDYFGL